MDMQITVEQGITRVLYRCEVEFNRTTEMLREVGRIALENQSAMLLFDVREAGEGPYHVSAIRHTEQLPALGIERSFRIAFLGRKGDPRLSYVDDVMVNRGFQSHVFTDEAESVAWLQSGL